MLRNVLLVACVGLAGLLGSCSKTAAPDRRDADVKAVKNLEVAWVADIATKSVDKVAGYYSDEGSVLMPNMQIITGKDNIKAAWKASFSDPNFALTFQSTKVDAAKSGDLAYSVGTYSMTLTNPKDKKPITDKGKYLTVFKKQADGNWKAVADMVSSDLPLPGAAK